MATMKGLINNFLHSDQKRLQEAWKQHQPPHFLSPPAPKPEKVKDIKKKDVKVKVKPAPAPAPSSSNTSSSSSAAEQGTPAKVPALSRFARRGRGRGSRHSATPRAKRHQFCCSYCNYASVRRYNTERHIRLRHPTYRYKCPLDNCGVILLDDTELRLHLQGHSGAAFFLRCRDCGVPCGDYDSLVVHQRSCGAIQGGSDAAAETENMASGEGEVDRVGGSHDDVGDSCHDDDGDSDDEDGTIVIKLTPETSEDMEEEQEEGGSSPTQVVDDAGSDDDDRDSVEIIEDDNLPVHFMVKEEREESSPTSCS
ncbi:uncharacterized protein [Littorina saxatilis]